MSSDLVAQIAAQDESVLIQPATGEIIDTADASQVARFLQDVRELGKLVADARKRAEYHLAEYATRVGTKTFELDGRKITVRDGDKISWDVDVLEQLVEAGLPEDRFNKLVTPVVTYKVDGRVAKQLAAANPVYAEIIGKAQTREPGNLYVAVS